MSNLCCDSNGVDDIVLNPMLDGGRLPDTTGSDHPGTAKARSLESYTPFSSVADAKSDPHINGDYLKRNPTWHVEFSAWKAQHLYELIQRKNLRPQSIGEVGCGAGEVLRQLQLKMDPNCEFYGYDIAPQAIEMAKTRTNDRLRFDLADFGEIVTPHFDLLLILEVVDHVEDCFGFLRMLKPRADLKIFSFSLDISVQNVLREGALLRRRINHSHLHQFSKETALATLKHTGYDVLDHCYLHGLARSRLARVAQPLRKLAFACSRDLTVRLFGGFSLLVVAR